MNKNPRSEFLISLTEKHQSLMLSAERQIWSTPETGYREWETQKYLAGQFEKLGYTLTYAQNIPGFYCDIDTGKPGPKLLIMGEMDSLIVSNHPECNPDTGFVHACGHHAQCAALLGIAAALKEEGALNGLSGSIRLMAVPAEELIEIGYRESLRQQGIIKYYGGKVELLSRGFMDGCDLAFMVHTTGGVKGKTYYIDDASNGCVAKTINFKGISSHAGGGPHRGVNALYAASAAMQAVNGLRETFKDDDHIRFHPIVTLGGGAVNAIPHDIVMESYVRGAKLDSIIHENHKINRALAGSAAAFGANVFLQDRPGYMPLMNNIDMAKAAVEAVSQAMGAEEIGMGGFMTGCTDMGDISQIMPALHPNCAGASGTGHGNDYRISDPVQATVGSAKFQLLLLDALLKDDAKIAKEAIKNYVPGFATREEFFATLDSLFLDKRAVEYNEDGTVTLNFAGPNLIAAKE